MKIDNRDFLVRFIAESDAIEGIADDPGLLQTQIEENCRTGHVGALLTLEKLARESGSMLDHQVICQTQELITAEQHLKPGGEYLSEEYVGRYRRIGVSIAGRFAPNFLAVPELMAEWVKEANTILRSSGMVELKELIFLVARLHFNYEFIHPFADGNGRSGRALVYFMLRRLNLPPFIFTASDRFETYYHCFANSARMAEYFRQKSASSDT